LSGPKLTKDFIREIFYNSTEIKIMKQKINSKKTFVSIDLSLKKSGISSLNEIISKYDIYVDKDENPEIFWMGLQKYTVINNGEELSLPRKEFSLLLLLISKPEKVFTREEIYSAIWGDSIVVGDRTIDVHIRKLREKIGEDYIRTVKGVGYKFVD
jgi:hypothetical protein